MPCNRRIQTIVATSFLGACFAVPTVAQTTEAKPAPGNEAPKSATAPEHPLTPKEMREAQLTADTEKLYELAQQLKVELDKSTKDTLSLTVVRKAAEIEKLAHSISERMKSN